MKEGNIKLNTRREISYHKQLFLILFYIYKLSNDEFFEGFPKISKDFRKISEDSPKVVESPENRFRTFPNIFEDCQRFPK